MGEVLGLAGVALLVAFASMFGLRWGLLAGGLALLAVSVAFSDVPLPWFRPRPEPSAGDPGLPLHPDGRDY